MKEAPPPASLSEQARLFSHRFEECFGDAAGTRFFFAPGRVNLMGAHLDYNGGPVMPTAIDRGTLFGLRPRFDLRLELASTVQPGRLSVPVDDLPSSAQGVWTDYPVGVLKHMLVERSPPSGMDVLVGGNLPIGAGLSSSASICVGTAFAFDTVWDLGGDAQAWIRSALFAEREFVGLQCGIMDPFAVALTRPGHLLWVDCADESVEHVPLDSSETRICVADTGIRRELARGDFNTRVDECRRAFQVLQPHAPRSRFLRDIRPELVEAHAHELDETLLRRARHVTSEVVRTFEARDALARGDLAAFGASMSLAHASLREDFEVSLPELDVLVETALEVEGVYGARLTGAGFGGCIVALCQATAIEALSAALSESYGERFGTEPVVETFQGDAGPREMTPALHHGE